jgi:hypothetical protein
MMGKGIIDLALSDSDATAIDLAAASSPTPRAHLESSISIPLLSHLDILVNVVGEFFAMPSGSQQKLRVIENGLYGFVHGRNKYDVDLPGLLSQ